MTTFGGDVSHFDSPDTRMFVTTGGLQFLTHKVGGDQHDAEYAAWWQLMRPLRDRVLLGGYWVLYPGTPATRADQFVATLDTDSPGWRDAPFLLQVDCEIWQGNRATLPGRADVRAFCDRLRQRAPKLMPIVYGPKWCYGDNLTGLGYPLWASGYVGGTGTPQQLYPGDLAAGWGTYSGQTPAILQFTSSATIANQTTCDADAFRGTLEQLTALAAPGWMDNVMALDWDDKPWSAAEPISIAAAVQSTYNNVKSLAAAQEAARVAEVQRDAAESAAIAGLVTLLKTLATTGQGAGITDAQLNNLIAQVHTAAGDAAAAAVGPLEQEIQSLRQHLGDDTPPPVTGVASVEQSDGEQTTQLPSTDPDIFTRTMRERAQRNIMPDQPR